MKNYKDLIVWQKAMQLVTLIYQETGKFPDDEKFRLTSQVKRSSVSIPSTLLKAMGGFTKKTTPDFCKLPADHCMRVRRSSKLQ